MTFCLGSNTFLNIDQDYCEIAVRCCRHHIAGKLLVPRRVSSDKGSFVCGKISISNVNRHALFAFVLKAIDQ